MSVFIKFSPFYLFALKKIWIFKGLAFVVSANGIENLLPILCQNMILPPTPTVFSTQNPCWKFTLAIFSSLHKQGPKCIPEKYIQMYWEKWGHFLKIWLLYLKCILCWLAKTHDLNYLALNIGSPPVQFEEHLSSKDCICKESCGASHVDHCYILSTSV